MLTAIQINYLNGSLDRLTLREIAEKMRITNLEWQLKSEGYFYSTKEKKYVKQLKENIDIIDLDYKKLVELTAIENFNYRIDPIAKALWENFLAQDKYKNISKGKLLSLALLEFVEKYK